MTCEDAIGVLADFLEQTLPRDIGEALQAHLSDCAPCRAYLRTYERTRGFVGSAGRVEMPAELRARLRSFLVDRLGGQPR